jgi:hypothetical protein
MPGVTSAPDVDRNRFSDDLDTDLLGQLDPTARDLILAVAAELNG